MVFSLYLIFFSFYNWFIYLYFFFLSCNIFLVFPFFLFRHFFRKKRYIYFFNFSYFKYLSRSIYTIFLFLSLLFCNLFYNFFLYTSFFLYTFVFWKISIQKLRKWCFTIAIAKLFYSSTTLKISLRSYMFLLT